MSFFLTVSARNSTDPSAASPDTSGILCCEVCGKYGLPHEFSASGRFCSLSCVGVYTGRRNKGREYVRHAKTVDGKIVKRKKKDKAKNRELSSYTDLPHVRNTRGCKGRLLGVKNAFVLLRSNQSRLSQNKDNCIHRQ